MWLKIAHDATTLQTSLPKIQTRFYNRRRKLRQGVAAAILALAVLSGVVAEVAKVAKVAAPTHTTCLSHRHHRNRHRHHRHRQQHHRYHRTPVCASTPEEV